MKLQDLFSIISSKSLQGLSETKVTGLFNDARQVISNSVFVAIKGHSTDGHSFIQNAIDRGAIGIVAENDQYIPQSYTGAVIIVPDSRAALDLLSSGFYNYPARELFCVGVTGTNGKTSVSYMVEAILNAGGMNTGVIGTVNHHLGTTIWSSNMTTPDPIFLQKRLREFCDHGAKAVVLEVSSHALDQQRVESMPFNSVVFTNLTRDHLDYHGTMEGYFKAKQRLTQDLLDRSSKSNLFAIINGDDPYGQRLLVSEKATRWTYGKNQTDLKYHIDKMDFTKTWFTINTPKGSLQAEISMSGEHNVQNAVAAIGVGLSAGLTLQTCVEALKKFGGVPGRLQSVPNEKSVAVFIDYAHTPDALENVLLALQSVRRNIKSQSKIWTIFGCGGDRDKGKRPMMAAIAEKYSDYIIVTSDNPRTEPPQRIIDEILRGIKEHPHVLSFEERREAISHVIGRAAKGDVVLIAGKGHEDYQIIGRTKHHFSDFEEAEKALKGRV